MMALGAVVGCMTQPQRNSSRRVVAPRQSIRRKHLQHIRNAVLPPGSLGTVLFVKSKQNLGARTQAQPRPFFPTD
jgi:hypothetical protein